MNDTGIMQIAVYRNSDRIKVHNTNASGLPAGYPSISVSSIIQCNSGDQISIYTKHGSTTSRSVAGEKYLTYFEVQRISC